MLKNNKGVTLALLIITVIVLLILATVTINATDTVLTRTRLQNAVSSMKLLQSKVESMYEEYTFNNTPKDEYVGEQVTNEGYLSMYGVTILPDDEWRVWTRDTLQSLGFDKNMLEEVSEEELALPLEQQEEKYIVNYTTGEVIYTTGVEDEDDVLVYTIKQITNTMYITNED